MTVMLHDNAASHGRHRQIWIGGTSGLARTMFNAYQSPRDRRRSAEGSHDEPWLVIGHQPKAPAWLSTFQGLCFKHLDFLKSGDDDEGRRNILDECQQAEQIVISIRPPLVARHTFQQASAIHNQMIAGLQEFLEQLMEALSPISSRSLHIIHVSSIAAIDHVQEQYLRSEASVPDPSSYSLYHPYDRFKRRCEEVIDDLISACSRLRITHVRLGAIFSDDKNCIQCSALALQARIGCYLPTRIDCNSARNVAVLLQAILNTAPPVAPVRYFYYTRPLSLASPVPYGEFLQWYRRGNDVLMYLWIPVVVVQWIVCIVHALAQSMPLLPFVQSIDYLLQVTRREHTFDISLVGAAYPGVASQEESMEQCFRRRRQMLSQR